MSEKPSYLGLLNAIAVAEAEAECYLDAWASVTPREDVRRTLQTIALREGEHGKAFAKRICELGFSVVPKEDPKAAERMSVACSAEMSDREKFECLGLGQAPRDGDDIFAGMFRDQNIDIQTGQLLGRYIAEERDSGRLFRECYSALVTADECCEPASVGSVEERLDRIERMLEKLVSERG
jgi:rubrerythrin